MFFFAQYRYNTGIQYCKDIQNLQALDISKKIFVI